MIENDEGFRAEEAAGVSDPSVRRLPRTPVVTTLLVANAVVFLLWSWPDVPTSIMVENFLVSWPHLLEGRVWVLITSVFSHNLLLHLVINMVVLLSFGKPMELLMGRGRFLKFYLLAGLVASVAHAVTSRFLLDRPDLPALGASGALAGTLMLFSFSFPKAKVFFLFFIPVPAILAALAFIAIDVWGLVAQIGGGTLPIGHGAHLGGALVGILYYWTRGGPLRDRRRQLNLGMSSSPQ
ncbi:MAG: rhomboid family intramembrane serine protease [Gemmatimonadota bacterium]